MSSHVHVHHLGKIHWNLTEKRTALNNKKARSSQAAIVSRQTPLSILLGELRATDHEIVLQAVDELRSRGCLGDNTLPWICLQYANLLGANLSTANLHNADLHKINLEKANLSYANLGCARLTRAKMQSANLKQTSLKGANLTGANLNGAKNFTTDQLAQADRMRASIMPDGSRYDGRFNLPGDFVDASLLHVDLNSPTAIASFYGISLDEFSRGQGWRREHLPSTSLWNESVDFQNAEIIMFQL